MRTKLALTTAIAALGLVSSVTTTSASEGVIELENVIGGPSRCYAESVLMPNFEYYILTTCRDLLYPVNPEVLSYVVWAQPLQGGDPIKLGDLGPGKALYKTKTSFGRIFVTQERDKNVRRPAGAVAISGNVQAIPFFANNSTSPVVPSAPDTLASPSPSPTPGPSLLSRFRTGGVITVISIIVIIIMLVVVKPFK